MLDAGPPSFLPLMQDPAFAKALARCGQRVVHLPNGQFLLHRRMMGLRFAMLPRVAPPPDLHDQLRAVGWHRRPVILSPEQPSTLPQSLRIGAPRQRAVIDLTGGIAACRARLHGKWRNQLVLAEGFGTHVTQGKMKPDPNHTVMVHEQTQSQQRKYANWPAALTSAFAAVAPDQTHLFRATHKGETLAHMLFLQHGAAATYHIGHITDAGKRRAAHNLLMWVAIQRLLRRGCVQIDLGLLDPRTPGLNRFKLRSGAVAQTTGGTHLYWRPLARA